MTGTFRQEISDALANPNLGGALTRFSEAYRTSRAKAYEGIDFEALRARIAEVKGDAAGRFPELVSRFREQAEKRGAKVFLADSPEKVRAYILDLAKKYPEKPILISFSAAKDCMEECKAFLEPRGVPTFPEIEQPFEALSILVRCHRAMNRSQARATD